MSGRHVASDGRFLVNKVMDELAARREEVGGSVEP